MITKRNQRAICFGLVLLHFLFTSSEAVVNLPNVKFLGYSFDAREGLPIISALRTPLISFTYQQGRTASIMGQVYSIPDQITVPTPVSSNQNAVSVQLFTSLQYVEADLYSLQTYSYQNTSSPFINGMYGQSGQWVQFNSTSGKNYTASTNLPVYSWATGLIGCQMLTSNFLDDLAALPTEFNSSTCPAFKKFLSIYGTHFINQTSFGGVVAMSSSYSSSHYNSVSPANVSSDLEQQFLLLTQSTPLNADQSQELSNLNHLYTSTVQLVGGQPS
jgi:hypothetical protein